MTVLCSVDDVKTFTPISGTYGKFDGMLTAGITAVSDMIRAYCRREFDKAVYTEFFPVPDYNPAYFVMLGEPPVDTNADFFVYYDRDSIFDPARTVLTSDQYELDPVKGKLYPRINTYAAPRGLKVVYTGGYATGSGADAAILQVPAKLRQACAIQTGNFVQRIAQQSLGKSQDSNEASSQQTFQNEQLLNEVAAMVKSYRRQLVGST